MFISFLLNLRIKIINKLENALIVKYSHHYGIWEQTVGSHFQECNLPVVSKTPRHWVAQYTERWSLDEERLFKEKGNTLEYINLIDIYVII